MLLADRKCYRSSFLTAIVLSRPRFGGVGAALEMLPHSVELNLRALRLQPHPDFFLNLGGVRFVMGELEEAVSISGPPLHSCGLRAIYYIYIRTLTRSVG